MIGADGRVIGYSKTFVSRSSRFAFRDPFGNAIRAAWTFQETFFTGFSLRDLPRPRFNVNHKGDVFLIEGSGLKELRREIGETLSPYGFDPNIRPVRKDGCTIALLHEDLLSGAFKPAKGNVLLTGDAAGLILPITFEGIGSALKSGLLAADAVMLHFKDADAASSSYLESIDPMRDTIRKLCKIQEELKAAAEKGPAVLAKALCDAYRETLTIQEE